MAALALMAVNRVAGLVLPGSTKYLIDDVIGKRQLGAPRYRSWAPCSRPPSSRAATVVRAHPDPVEGRAAAHRGDAAARCRSTWDACPWRTTTRTRPGSLVSRIMNDVEGVRNLIGTGLVEFAGGLLTAAIALLVMLRLSPGMTDRDVRVPGRLRGRPRSGPSAPCARSSASGAGSTREVTGRLTESLGGVRVVKGYHAEAREAAVFARGRGAAPRQRAQDAHRDVRPEPRPRRSCSASWAPRSCSWGARDPGGPPHRGRLLHLHGVPRLPGGAHVPDRVHRHPAHGGARRARADARGAARAPGGRGSAARGRRCRELRGEVAFEDVVFAYEPGKPVLDGVSFRSEPGTVTALVGPSGAGKSTIIGLVCAFHVPTSGPRPRGRGGPLHRAARLLPHAARASSCRTRSSSTAPIRENVAFSRPGATDDEILAACRIARVDEFAERFPEGYETVVGERGVKLSGRPEAARLHRARHPRRPAHPHPRRGDVEPRLRVGSAHPGRALAISCAGAPRS